MKVAFSRFSAPFKFHYSKLVFRVSWLRFFELRSVFCRGFVPPPTSSGRARGLIYGSTHPAPAAHFKNVDQALKCRQNVDDALQAVQKTPINRASAFESSRHACPYTHGHGHMYSRKSHRPGGLLLARVRVSTMNVSEGLPQWASQMELVQVS